MTSSLFLFLSAFAAAQTCEEPGYPFPPECCEPPPPVDTCALQAVASDDAAGAMWVGSDGAWHSNTWWMTTPTQSADMPYNILWQPTMAGGSRSTNEIGCGVTTGGAIECFGNLNGASQITGRPTGGAPYSSVALGNQNSSTTANLAALDSGGYVVVWGNVTGNNLQANKPSAGGFDSVGIGVGNACAVDASVAGVTCWGSTANNIVAGRPTTGNYKFVAVGRQHAGAVTTAGALVMWGNTISTNFRNEWTAQSSPVAEVYFIESGDEVAVAWHDDHTITVWQDPSNGRSPVIGNAPCVSGVDCPGATADLWHSSVKFRTAPRISKYDAPSTICGVVEDDPNNVYGCGDVICWGHMNETEGDPELVSECADPTYCF